MEKVLQEFFWVHIPFKRYQNTSECGTALFEEQISPPKISTVDCLEAATSGILQNKVFLEILQSSHENTCARVSFLITLQALDLKLY